MPWDGDLQQPRHPAGQQQVYRHRHRAGNQPIAIQRPCLRHAIHADFAAAEYGERLVKDRLPAQWGR